MTNELAASIAQLKSDVEKLEREIAAFRRQLTIAISSEAQPCHASSTVFVRDCRCDDNACNCEDRVFN